jgi:hypothetical protein
MDSGDNHVTRAELKAELDTHLERFIDKLHQCGENLKREMRESFDRLDASTKMRFLKPPK